MIKSILILPDVHLTTKLPEQYKLVKKYIKTEHFDEIILLGDFMDCSALSHWNENKRRLIEGMRYSKELQVANTELRFLLQHTKKLTWIEGNHEDWVNQYVDKHPEMEGLLEITEQLQLKKQKIEWIPMNKLYKVGSMYFTHGMYTNKYHAAKHLQVLGCNICYGHTHNSQSFMQNMKMQDPHKAYGLGCLCDHEPIYMRGRPANWLNSFGLMYLDTKSGNFNMNEIVIADDKFIVDGVLYK